METVRAKINIELFRSRYPGLLPYVEYGGDGSVKTVADISKGNIGGFPVSIVEGKSYKDLVSDFHSLMGILESARFFIKVSDGGYAESDIDRFLKESRDVDENIFSFRDFINLMPECCIDEASLISRSDGLFSVPENNCDLLLSLNGKNSLLDYTLTDVSGDYLGIEAFQHIERDFLGRIYVPEYYRSGSLCPIFLYWRNVLDLIEKMDLLRNGKRCCEIGDYNDYGGDLFYSFLQQVYKDGLTVIPVSDNIKLTSFSFQFAITNSYDNIGLYNIVDDDAINSEIASYWYEKDDIKIPSEFDRFLHINGYLFDDRGNKLDGTYPVVINGKAVAYPGCFEYSDGEWKIIRRPINEKVQVNSDLKIEYRGDFITECVQSDDSYIIKYVIGGIFEYDKVGNAVWSEHTGVEYVETLKFKDSVLSGYFPEISDGVSKYTQRSFILDASLGYNDNYGKSCNVRQAICHYMVSDVMSTIDRVPAISQDYNIGISDDITQSISVSVDRGASAAFESHYKICECKTFADLKNYGNNFFGLS